MTTDAFAALHAWLAAGAGGTEPAGRVHETPIASVFVFQDRVLKLKKPVDFGFLDFTTREKRAWAIYRELRFNREAAPDVYRCVHAVAEAACGFTLAGVETGAEVVDHVLEMRPFAADAVLAHAPERIDLRLAERLGREVARVQAGAPVSQQGSGSAALAYVVGSNAGQLLALADRLGPAEVERLVEATEAAAQRLRPELDARGEAGFVRRCHGDLHLANVVVEGERPILFDCIEFNDRLSEIDVGYDLAFLLMDLAFHGRRDAAAAVLNAWLDESGRSFGVERFDALRLLPLFQSVRAAVRAHVCAHAGEGARARAYLAAALDHLEPAPARLWAVGGLSGSGKSTLARALAPRVGGAPGAVVLRSDEVRKRLLGLQPRERAPAASYTAAMSARVYATMSEEADCALSAGWSVILDAAFLQPQEREAAEALGRSHGLALSGLWMQGAPDLLRGRVRARRDDVSDADEAVLDRQLLHDPGPIAWRIVSCDQPLDGQLAAALHQP